MCICVSYSCTRHITHKLHMHILHGKSLEPKECINFTSHKYGFHSLYDKTWSMIPPSNPLQPPYHTPSKIC